MKKKVVIFGAMILGILFSSLNVYAYWLEKMEVRGSIAFTLPVQVQITKDESPVINKEEAEETEKIEETEEIEEIEEIEEESTLSTSPEKVIEEENK